MTNSDFLRHRQCYSGQEARIIKNPCAILAHLHRVPKDLVELPTRQSYRPAFRFSKFAGMVAIIFFRSSEPTPASRNRYRRDEMVLEHHGAKATFFGFCYQLPDVEFRYGECEPGVDMGVYKIL